MCDKCGLFTSECFGWVSGALCWQRRGQHVNFVFLIVFLNTYCHLGAGHQNQNPNKSPGTMDMDFGEVPGSSKCFVKSKD